MLLAHLAFIYQTWYSVYVYNAFILGNIPKRFGCRCLFYSLLAVLCLLYGPYLQELTWRLTKVVDHPLNSLPLFLILTFRS